MVMMLTIVPGAPRRTMSATAACMRKNGPRRFTATCWSNSSGLVSSSVPRLVSPAALTRLSIRPNRSTVAATDACALATSATSARAQVGGEFLARLRAAAGHHHGRALADGRAGDLRAQALGAPADQYDPILQ